MALDYENDPQNIIDRLEMAHNPQQSIIRGKFFEKEYNFFKENISNKRVLVAGSGLGHDSFELAKYNKEVIGIEILKDLVNVANSKLREISFKNVSFNVGDITKLDYSDKEFDVAVLNMGTIGNFENKEIVLKELLRVAKIVYFDFYPPSPENLEERKKLYSEELWKNVRISGNSVISDDGLESVSLTKEEVSKMIKNIGARVKYFPINDFALMAEVKRE